MPSFAISQFISEVFQYCTGRWSKCSAYSPRQNSAIPWLQNFAWIFDLGMATQNCTIWQSKSQKAELPWYSQKFHFLSAELPIRSAKFPFLSKKFLFSECRIITFWAQNFYFLSTEFTGGAGSFQYAWWHFRWLFYFWGVFTRESTVSSKLGSNGRACKTQGRLLVHTFIAVAYSVYGISNHRTSSSFNVRTATKYSFLFIYILIMVSQQQSCNIQVYTLQQIRRRQEALLILLVTNISINH